MHDKVRGIVLAGVYDWGSCALERILPRPLLPIGNSPLICHVLNWLREGGISTATICGNSHTGVLRHFLGDGSRLKIALDYFEDRLPRGPAGCARNAGIDQPEETFVVAEGTIVPRINLSELLDTHARSGAVLTVVAAPAHRVNGSSDESMVPVGIYVFSRRALEYVAAAGYQDIKEALIPHLYGNGERIVTYDARMMAPRVTGPDSILAVNEWMLEQIAREHADVPEYRQVDRSKIHQSVVVHPTARIIGPVLIGPGTTIAEGATIIGPTTIGADCGIEAQAVISRSAIWERCTVGRMAILDSCILTNDSTVEPEEIHRNVLHTPAPRRRNSLLDGQLLRRLKSLPAAASAGNGTSHRRRNGRASRSAEVFATRGNPTMWVGTPVGNPCSRSGPGERK